MTSGDGVVRSRRDDHLAASTFLERGWMRLALGDWAGARGALEQVHLHVPYHSEARVLLAWVRAEQQDAEGALALLSTSPIDDAVRDLATVVRALALVRLGHAPEAIMTLESIASPTGDPRVRLYAPLVAGMAHAVRGAHNDAMAAFARCLSLGPNCAQAWDAQGEVALQMGDRVTARESWSAGSHTARFSAWGRRCAERLAALDGMGSAPEVSA